MGHTIIKEKCLKAVRDGGAYYRGRNRVMHNSRCSNGDNGCSIPHDFFHYCIFLHLVFVDPPFLCTLFPPHWKQVFFHASCIWLRYILLWKNSVQRSFLHRMKYSGAFSPWAVYLVDKMYWLIQVEPSLHFWDEFTWSGWILFWCARKFSLQFFLRPLANKHVTQRLA